MNIFNFFLFFLGTSGLKAEAKVLARDQRYASNAARDLSQNFTRSLAPTDYFDRIYASLCVQMTDLQHRLYEVESVVNPAAYRAAVARDRNQQLRRNQWARRNQCGGGGYGGGYGGGHGDDQYDDEATDPMNADGRTDLNMSASQVALLHGGRHNSGVRGASKTSLMRYDTGDAVEQRFFVGYGRGLEAAEQGNAQAYRSHSLSRYGANNHRHSGTTGGTSEKLTTGMLERVLQSQYRAYMATAARVASCHDVVNQMRVQYLEAINEEAARRTGNVDEVGVGECHVVWSRIIDYIV